MAAGVERTEDLTHHKGRLAVLAVLHETPRASFTELRDALGQPDGSVGRYINTLEEAGLVSVERTWDDRRPRSWASITPAGQHALRRHLDAMAEMIARFDSAVGRPPTRSGPEGRATAVLFAMWASEHHDDAEDGLLPASIEGAGGVPGLRSAALDAPPGEFTFLGGGPVSRFFEFPQIPGVNESFSPSYEVVQRLYMRHGLAGGYALGWARDPGSDEQLNVAARVFELADDRAAAALVDAVSWSDDVAAGLPVARSNVSTADDGRVQANVLFAVHHLAGLLIVYGRVGDVVEVARACARRQYDRMAARGPFLQRTERRK